MTGEHSRSARLGEGIAVDSWLLGVDDKRLHFFHEMRSLESGIRVAAGEQLDLHFDLGARRAAPFPGEVRARLAALWEAQRSAGLPTGIGKTSGVRG
ncbi:thioesterase family protein [Tomitella fengzijianii]|uniref:Uncharacterized protein n=1 Tax=Tomitella fengzijianii TaxID=2597660 RepID=A0A516X5A5_9ACTN|nr:thioesterase family protein [Tomitella fengzijianii]QDQ98245.1 hypothetical protein FO059_14175 [Tomitella fengzijianii]